MGPFIAVVMMIALVALIMWPKFKYSGDREQVINQKILRRDAKIVNIVHNKVGTKNDSKIETCVIFSDGYRYMAYETDRKDHFGSYTISVSEEAIQDIIIRAKEAHEAACGAAGIVKPFSCGKCGHAGPYEGNCPQCGSSLKRYLN